MTAKARKELILECDTRLKRKPAIVARKRWLAENKRAIEAYNRMIAVRGVFSEGLRRF